MVVSLCILLINKVHIVGADQFDTILLGQLNKHLIGLLLQGECLPVSTNCWIGHLMALQLQIIVITKHAVIPFKSFARTCYIAIKNLLGHLTGNTCRAHNQVLMIFFQICTVRTWTHIIAINP